MNIILLAPIAAGKGTQSELLVKNYNMNHISTGDLLKSVKNPELNKKIRDMIESGILVTDDIVLDVLEDYINNTDNMNLLFDGFPRNIYQANKLDEMLEKYNTQVDYVILLNAPKEVLADRTTGRRVCKSCGSIYNVNIDSLKPKMDNVCDKCGNELIQRNEDNLETFEIRYNTYLEQTKPLIEYYKNKSILYEIDSTVSVEEIFEKIKKVINN